MNVQSGWCIERQTQLLTHMQTMGFNLDQVRAFLNNIGIAEEDPLWIITHINNPQYSNILKMS